MEDKNMLSDEQIEQVSGGCVNQCELESDETQTDAGVSDSNLQVKSGNDGFYKVPL